MQPLPKTVYHSGCHDKHQLPVVRFHSEIFLIAVTHVTNSQLRPANLSATLVEVVLATACWLLQVCQADKITTHKLSRAARLT